MRIDGQVRKRASWCVALLAIVAGCGDDGGVVPTDGGVEPSDGGVDAAQDAAPDGAIDAGDAGDAGVAPMIISPPNGAALRARRQVFEWTATGSNYRLRIGTTPGAADLFESEPLGDATSVTVDGLPLTGVPIFAELESGPDDARVSSINEYVAPMRWGLAVVVDFADARLEDWTGPGMNDLTDVRTQLDEMEAHWDWLSRGLEKTRWDLIRVELAENLSDTAFPDWNAFRNEVVRLATQEVSIADYDVDSDGVLDGMFAIVSDQETEPPYAIGGMSRNQGANIFVDGQDTQSVVGRHTGNFNHEFGHAMGLPDLYGSYDSVGDLTVMAGSWALPPNDFTAYERIRMGWLEPVVADQTMLDLVVPDAGASPFAVKVPTARPEEYFLVEHRKRPASGFGSAAFDHDGIAVYHVLEGSNQWMDPPLLALVPADGTTVLSAPERDDLAYPENVGLERPFVLHTYFGGDPVFAIDDLRWTPDGSLTLDLLVLSTGPGSSLNQVRNSSVETGTAWWRSAGWRPDYATFGWASIGAGGSAHSLVMASPIENDIEWTTPIVDLVPGRAYHVCAALKGDAVTSGRGATLSISGSFVHSEGMYGTFDWTRRCMIYIPTETSLELSCRMGGFGQTTSGEMWCDDVGLYLIDRAFGG